MKYFDEYEKWTNQEKRKYGWLTVGSILFVLLSFYLKARTNTANTGNNISAISYNHLNLPQAVTAVAGNANYVYDATGRKLRSTQAGVTTDYVDGIEWQGSASIWKRGVSFPPVPTNMY